MATTNKQSKEGMATAKQIAAVRQVQKQALMVDCPYFIETFVKIEDRDGAELAMPFMLWDAQKEALESIEKYKLNVGVKARQLGFTWLALSYALWIILHPGKSVLALSKTEEDAKELIRRVVFMLRNLPPWLVMQGTKANQINIVYDHMQTSVTVFHYKGEPSYFKSFPAGQNSGAGFTGNLLILDEWGLQQYAEEIWTAAFPTINRPTGGKVIGISTMRLGTHYHNIVLGALDGSNGFNLIFWPWNVDPRRDKLWYENTRKALGEDKTKQEYPATIDECLSMAGGRFFTEINVDVHIKKPLEQIPAYYSRYVSIDYGLDALAALWYWVDSTGKARVYRELYKSDLIISQAAKAILTASGGEKITCVYAPPDLWNRRQETGKSAADIFTENGVYLTMTSNDRHQGWMNIKEWLLPFETKDEQTGQKYTTASLTIDAGCAPNLWRSFANIQKDPDKYGDILDKGAKNHELTHCIDSLRAFCAARTPLSRKPEVIKQDIFVTNKPQNSYNGVMNW